MKKLLTISILAVMLILMTVTGVNATSNGNLAQTLYNIGAKYGMTNGDKVKIERYLADNPVTETEANAIVAKANSAAKIMDEAGTKDYKSLPADKKAELKSLANEDLVAEVRYRINNLSVDYLISSGQLEQLIQDSPESLFPQMVATERPDKVSNFLLEGRVVIVVNGSPYVLVAPGVFVDFITSPEDLNLKYQFSNLEKIIRLLAIFLSLLLPGIYIAVTNYHQELIPTELLFTIAAARESVPFPTFVEILLMEVSFELIREAGLRVPTPLGSTIGIVGALILGEAAVSASLVSPVLIIIIAITGICSFSIPDFSLNFTFRIYRFVYIILGYMAGFLGISFGIFIQLAIMCKLKSFGSPYINPYILGKNKRSISSYFIPPIWKRERTSSFVHAQKKFSQQKISMVWRKK